MQTSWPEPVERVAGFLREAGAEARLEEFGSGTPTAEDAAGAAGCTLEQVVKSLVLVCDGRPVVVLVPGDRRADTAKVAASVDAAAVRVALAEEVEEATGFAPGGVAPFPLPPATRVFLDRTLLVHERVWVGAGSPHHLASLKPTELLRLAHAEPIDAVLERAVHTPRTPRKGDSPHA
ncbi:MAG TPA: YbaK/EbsC family protein [Gaiellaceae bacterium]|nr:YbaK/EbsC family protein [Gaiellaceae bacterium]